MPVFSLSLSLPTPIATSINGCISKIISFLLLLLAVLLIPPQASAQTGQMQAGEAFLTRFSGTKVENGTLVINPDGIVGSILDIRNPAEAAKGQKLNTILQRHKVKASDIGQVFGVALDGASPPNIYLSATSAFGLHRNSDNSDWMNGMWGVGGGPGTIWKLNAANGYQPEIFANITLDGRLNSGPSLGNLVVDSRNNQLFVSDLETGMIHRISLTDGSDLGHYDHGIKGRASFKDIPTGQTKSLSTVTFNVNSKGLVNSCPFGDFAKTPSCWNFADFRRRTWGIGLRFDKANSKTRLYYSLWGAQSFGNPQWNEVDANEQKNSVWSIGLNDDGSFNKTDIRREFFLPDFFFKPADISRKGPSHPVADISFPACGDPNKMIVAERGGIRNPGLDKENTFTYPYESRIIRYSLDQNGTWQLEGHLDVGFPKRKNEPLDRANSAGGASFGFGYDANGILDKKLTNQFLWITGDNLCSLAGACFNSATGTYSDNSEVHGLQGMPADAPVGPFPMAPEKASVPNSSYMIDADTDGDVTRNEASYIGDIEIFQPCAAKQADDTTPPYPTWGEGAPVYPDTAPNPWGTTPIPGPGPGPGPLPKGPDAKIKVPDPLLIDPMDIAIKKTKVGDPCFPGGICFFEFTVTNVGKQLYKNDIKFKDQLPNGWVLDNFKPNPLGWTCGPKGANQFECKLSTGPGKWLKPGESSSVMVAAKVSATEKSPSVENCATLLDNPQMPQDNYPAANDKSCVKVALQKKVGTDLSIKKDIVGTLLACKPDSICKFEISITNKGPDPYIYPVVFEDAIPGGWKFSKQTGSEWQPCKVTGQIIRCETLPTIAIIPPIITLKPNETIKLGLEFKTPPAKAKSKKVWNCAKVFPPTNAGDKTPANDKSCILVEIPGDPSLEKKTLIKIKKSKANNKPCYASGYCTYTFIVRNLGTVAYKGPISIIDNHLPGVKYHNHSPKSPLWNCYNIGGGNTGKIRCDYQNGASVNLPPDSTKFLYPLTLTVKWPQWPPQLVSVDNCATAIWPTGKSKKSCVTVPVAKAGGTVTGHTDWGSLLPWNWFSAGTLNCTPPNCSFYQFTAELQKTDKSQTYNGPLNMSINLPPGSDFPNARIVRAGKSCPASGWSCNKTGNGFDCVNKSCTVRPGEQIAVRMDGRVAPNLKVPPRVEQKKTACGVLKWRIPHSAADAIEQQSSIRTARSCFSTKILPRKPDAIRVSKPCPQGWHGRYQPNCRKPTCRERGMVGNWPRCKPRVFIPKTPQFKMIPGKILCPRGQVPYNGRCINKIN